MSRRRRGSPRPDSSPSRRTYSRGGRARCIARVFRELLTQRGRALEDIFAARDHVQSMPECTGSVGVVGFCMGGQFALLMAPKGLALRHRSTARRCHATSVRPWTGHARSWPASAAATRWGWVRPHACARSSTTKASRLTPRSTRTPATASRTSCGPAATPDHRIRLPRRGDRRRPHPRLHILQRAPGRGAGLISSPMCTLSMPPLISECGMNHRACHQ